MSYRRGDTSKVTSSKAPASKRQIIDCVLLPAPRYYKPKCTAVEESTGGRVLRARKSQVQASSSVIISKATTAPRRRSTNVKQKSLDQPPKLTSQKEPSQAASASTKSFSPVNMGLITPATSLQRLPSILPTPTPPPDVVSSTQPAHEEESPIDEDIGSASAESIMDAKQWPVESSLCLATDVEEDEDFYGFQMLNPQQCIMLPWTNVSTTERSLYVPPALGNILHQMKHTLEVEQNIRLQVEERFLKLVRVKSADEERLQALQVEVDLLKQGKEILESQNREFQSALEAVKSIQAGDDDMVVDLPDFPLAGTKCYGSTLSPSLGFSCG